ncbi:hypothetical protein C3729_05310 [Cloacibacterium normanense]|uniref:Uncharacterized protein n=2 Tax=Cloacibacterium normanense TaxID=237258 RepID=A0A2S7I748_9FLAO|nr:hypothetical protein C3729_05310 [Cloacibacterium normanense]
MVIKKINMKITFFMLFIANTAFSQTDALGIISNDANYSRVINQNNLVDKKNEVKIEGSPYLFNEYNLSKIGDYKDEINIKYNIFSDEVEFVKNGQLLALNKTPDLSKIRFINYNTILVLKEINGNNGYYLELFNNNGRQLLKKLKIRLEKGRTSQNSYDLDRNSRYIEDEPIYYFFIENNLIASNKLKKIEGDLEKKGYNIKEILKKEKLSIKKDQDLIKLINLINK